jgi:hypothetical protein
MKRASLAFGILLSSVILVDCGSKMVGPGEEVESQANAVSADGAIVATTKMGTFTPGETSGDFKVDDGGQASYTIRLWTPDGPMGVKPQLALHYNSANGPSSVGMGFTLAGNVISMISRCRKTIPVDGDVSPIEFTGTTYCLRAW